MRSLQTTCTTCWAKGARSREACNTNSGQPRPDVTGCSRTQVHSEHRAWVRVLSPLRVAVAPPSAFAEWAWGASTPLGPLFVFPVTTPVRIERQTDDCLDDEWPLAHGVPHLVACWQAQHEHREYEDRERSGRRPGEDLNTKAAAAAARAMPSRDHRGANKGLLVRAEPGRRAPPALHRSVSESESAGLRLRA
jgi:hypothetical protein